MLEHAQFKEHFTKLERSMEVSARLGIGAVGCSSFAWPAEYTGGKPTWPMRWATRGGIISDGDMEKLVEAFSMFADIAERYDVDIAFLMMQWNYGNTSRNFRRIVETVGSRRFKALWCPADNYNCGEVDNATAGFENLRPYLHGVHAKDLRTINGSTLEFEYTPIGEGHVDYPTILRNLRDNRCDVVLSIATHFLPASGLPARSHADELRQHPQADWRVGVAFIASLDRDWFGPSDRWRLHTANGVESINEMPAQAS